MTGIRSLLLVMLALSCASASGQRFNAGIMGGINISQIEGDGFAGYNKAGPAAGIFVNTLLSETLTGQIEINYSAKGSVQKSTPDNPVFYRIHLSYMEIPVIARYHFPVGITGEAGMSAGYLFRSLEEDQNGRIPGTIAFRKWELAALGGVGYPVTVNLSVFARISYSLIPVRPHAGGGTWYFNRGQNNNVITFLLQYQF